MAKLRILLRAPENTLFIGKAFVHLEKTDSTNTYVKNLLNANKPQTEGLLVVSDEQFAGRGQLTNVWISAPGQNLTLSILFYPTFLRPPQLFYFNKAIALAVRACIANYIPQSEVLIKWPNDILVDDRKIAGILIENTLRTNSIESAIAGIGININQSFNKELNFKAVSIMDITDKSADINDIMHLLCGMLEKFYLLLRGYKFEEIDNLYHKYLFGLGEDRNFMVDRKAISGKIIGVGDDGLLNLETKYTKKAFEVKEISFIFIE